jgi:hypothetical protein
VENDKEKLQGMRVMIQLFSEMLFLRAFLRFFSAFFLVSRGERQGRRSSIGFVPPLT